MKTRHIQVIGETAKPLPDRLQEQSTHSLELTDDQYSTYVNSTYFKVVNGEPVAKTSEEREAQLAEIQKQQAIKESKELRDSLLAECTVEIRDNCWVKTRALDYPIIKGLIERLSPLEVYPNFTQRNPEGDTQIFDVTREELESAYEAGENLQVILRQEHAARVKAILNG